MGADDARRSGCAARSASSWRAGEAVLPGRQGRLLFAYLVVNRAARSGATS